MTATATLTTIEKIGSRLYFVNSPFSAKDAIKKIGSHWDGERRQWWIGVAKKTDAEALLAILNTPPSMRVTEESAKIAESLGLRPETPAEIVADKLADAGRDKEAAAIRSPKQDPDEIRLTGKGRYKGREYYAGSITKDGMKVRLLTLPDADGNYLDFWAYCSEVEQTKTYTPRQVWDGRRYSGRTVTRYTTLGSIAEFIKDQREAKASGEPQCGMCSKRGTLHHDLETGMMCCYSCCDMPE